MPEDTTSPANGSAEKNLQLAPDPIATSFTSMEQWKAEFDREQRRYDDARAAKFALALAKAQAKFSAVKRTRLVTVRPRDQTKSPYTFAYAPLDVILDATLKALNQEGFFLTQAIVKGERADYVRTELVCEHGTRFNMTPIFSDAGGPQAYNSALTYARRAGVTLLLSIAAEEDDDANDAEGNEAQHRPSPGGAGKGSARPGKPQPAAAPRGTPQPAAAPRGTRVVLDPGETTHQQSAEDQIAARRVVGTGPQQDFIREARTPTDGYGRRADTPSAAPEGEALELAEGRIADAIQEFHEAAVEGRRGGIESIWEEIRGDEFIATQTWARLKEQHPDSFATVSAVLKPAQDRGSTGTAERQRNRQNRG